MMRQAIKITLHLVSLDMSLDALVAAIVVETHPFVSRVVC